MNEIFSTFEVDVAFSKRTNKAMNLNWFSCGTFIYFLFLLENLR
jgi:hypothetical protein